MSWLFEATMTFLALTLMLFMLTALLVVGAKTGFCSNPDVGAVIDLYQ